MEKYESSGIWDVPRVKIGGQVTSLSPGEYDLSLDNSVQYIPINVTGNVVEDD